MCNLVDNVFHSNVLNRSSNSLYMNSSSTIHLFIVHRSYFHSYTSLIVSSSSCKFIISIRSFCSSQLRLVLSLFNICIIQQSDFGFSRNVAKFLDHLEPRFCKLIEFFLLKKMCNLGNFIINREGEIKSIIIVFYRFSPIN